MGEWEIVAQYAAMKQLKETLLFHMRKRARYGRFIYNYSYVYKKEYKHRGCKTQLFWNLKPPALGGANFSLFAVLIIVLTMLSISNVTSVPSTQL